MTFSAEKVSDLMVGDKVQLAIDLRVHKGISGIGTWTSYAGDSICIGNAVYEGLTGVYLGSDEARDTKYLWLTGRIIYVGPSVLHLVPVDFTPTTTGRFGQAIHAHEVCEIDIDSTGLAVIMVDNREPRIAPVHVEPRDLQAAGAEDPGLFDLPGTTYLSAEGTFPLMILDDNGIVRMVVDADGEPRSHSADDFPMDWLHTDWGDNFARVPNMTDDMRHQALSLLDFSLASERLFSDDQ